MRAPGITSCIRLMERKKVDFPQPDGPMMAVTMLGAMLMVTSRMARRLPYQAETASALTGSPMNDSFGLSRACPRRQAASQEASGEIQDDDDGEQYERSRPGLPVLVGIRGGRIDVDLMRKRLDRSARRKLGGRIAER